jgi:recombination protein RecA
MPRKKKEETVEETDTEDKVENKFPLPDLDISKLVNTTRGRYDKKQDGLARELTTGDKIILSDDDDDYIISKDLQFWKPLTGIKGVPYGRIIQVAGKPDSGKTTTAMAFMKAAQEVGTLVILWDSERKFSAKRYKNSIGGDPSTVAIVPTNSITEGAKLVSWYIKDAKEQNPYIKILVVWDSVGASLNTKEDIDDDVSDDYDKQPGVTAKQVSWAIKKFNALIARYRNEETGKHTIAVCCVNQVYTNIGSVGYTEKGGTELYYLSSIILNLTRKKDLSRVRKGEKLKYGIVTRAKVKKNHLFDGEDCVAELDLVVSADGIKLEKEVKSKADKVGITGWNDPPE